MFWPVILGISCIKTLLMFAYRSTDFEVHRNWLAITHSLPVSKWYYDHTSEWTLDYPPLFAWFEFILSKIAWYFDPLMLKVENLNYASVATVVFQRVSVIASDLVYAYGCKICSEEVGRASGQKSDITYQLFIILFGNAGLILVDHIHFQYNGFLFGILFISIARMIQRREIEAAFWFSVLLNLKHIYLYIAPAYFIYLLRSYCLFTNSEGKIQWNKLSVIRLLKLGVTVLAVFGLSFGPFIYMGQLNQVLSRLFPFKRGLSHAYWAPNFWALYNFADKILEISGSKFGLMAKSEASMTGGLVQEFNHAVLPSVSPLMTLVATVLSIIPVLVHLWKNPNSPWQFVRGLVICGFGSFMFGWHVHEKAVLLIILPLGLLCMQRRVEAQIFVLMSIVGHFSLFPLIFTHHETPIKVLVLILHALITTHTLQSHWDLGKSNHLLPQIHLCSGPETFYVAGLIPLFMYYEFGHRILGLAEKLPFLPLMLISVYCALGIFYAWINYYCFVLSAPKKGKKKIH
ncbi:dolichyl pyrophosphate Glc1Man9GlcNAc2 alpha-1,3-glucosyltransferase isoform X1 [Macrobrachium rosenbergii]|uniref:dolichyl pyrophosphate Glc1Man9GlcNAc2 alpha-1,3-glucosyltransferase isoform X1 n=1 Tax=Macrobrachium rosenbergii TaxID=79674 RepID=UPI0034D6EAB9